MKYKYILLSVLYMALIWFLSSQAGVSVPIPSGFDKAIHFAEYGILGFLLGRGLGRRRLWISFLLVAAWGIVDEWHQSWVPLRDASPWDAAADAAGALAGTLFAAAAEKPDR